jgi:hypothetical protein
MKKADILARRVNRYLRLQESLKPVYKRLDDLLAKILPDMKPNQVAGAGILKDNFAQGNIAWKSTKFNQYVIERVKQASSW